MTDIEIFITCVSAIVLFLFGLESFSKEIQAISGQKFRRFVAKFTNNSLFATLIGALITAVIQSSTATSIIAIGLVNAGVLSFKNSLPIIIGANIGTTVTAQLIAFKLTNFAPFIIIIGFLITIIRSRFSLFGRSIFYFGLVFFTLNLISSSLSPLQQDERLLSILLSSHSLMILISIGAIFTAIVQSSSVTTGVIIIFVSENLMSIPNAIAIIIGANIGTTITAILASFKMEENAKKTAYAHVFFNLTGAILFLPFLQYLPNLFVQFEPAQALAHIHVLFNVGTSILFLIFLNPYAHFIERISGHKNKEDLPSFEFPKIGNDLTFEITKNFLDNSFETLLKLIKENYKLTSLCLETDYSNILNDSKNRVNHFEYIKNDFTIFYSNILSHFTQKEEINCLLKLLDQYEYLYQIQDTLKDIISIKEHMSFLCIKLNNDMIDHLKELSTQIIIIFSSIEAHSFKEAKELFYHLEVDLTYLNRDILLAMLDDKRKDAGFMLHFLTYTKRLKDKLSNLSKRLSTNEIFQNSHSASTHNQLH